jgi:glycosyltransferase involved in cell wall biosynthesis
LRKTLLELAQKLEVNKYVRFVGTVPRTLMPKLMQASSIYVNASLSDTTPISLIEATASGLPIVSSDVGGISDVVINGFNGFLCPPRDPKAIADIILYLLENPSEIKRVGLNGRKLSEERFNIERKIDKIVEIYRKLVER